MKIADMHTHSRQSHDSQCKIEDMYRAQIARGTEIFAVTNHVDVSYVDQWDIFSGIPAARAEIDEISLPDGHKILFGIEISESFWNEPVAQKALTLLPYDVIIGSVHSVRLKGYDTAYSWMDFSVLPQQTIRAFLDAYFDDVLTLLDTTDFDILAHLTCPLRYINGKYGKNISLAPYQAKIEKILKRVIGRGVALEVNSSSLSLLGVPMPDRSILQQYYDMGGKLITLGSDAHSHENASFAFEDIIAMLKDIGFDSIYYYENRKPTALPI